MKIDEVKKGTEYALNDRHGDPRRVEALGIVTVDDRAYNGKLERYELRHVRLIAVKYLDSPTRSFDAAKGSKVNVNARELVAPWKEIGPNLLRRLEEKEACRVLTKELTKRVNKLLGRSFDGYVTVSDIKRPMLDVNGKSFMKMLELAEKGLTNDSV